MTLLTGGGAASLPLASRSSFSCWWFDRSSPGDGVTVGVSLVLVDGAARRRRRRSCRPCRPCGARPRPRSARPCPCRARACAWRGPRAAIRPDQLLVDAGHGDLGGALDLEGDALGRFDLDGVAVAEVQLQLLADQLCAIADTLDLQVAGVALGDADDHVVDERAGQAVELARALLIVRTLDAQLPIVGDHGTSSAGVRSRSSVPLGPFTLICVCLRRRRRRRRGC